MTGKARLFNIVPGASFLPELSHAILDDALGLGLSADDQLGLARTTIYLPTRRAVAALSQHLTAAITARTGSKATLLPRIRPLGGLDEAEVELAAAALPGTIEAEIGEGGDPPVPPAIAPLRRKLLLARQIEAWGRSINRACFDLDEASARLIPDGIGEAAELATHLAELIDTMHASGIHFDKLKGLDAARFDQLWEFTLGFLKIAGETWPSILAHEGALDPADRRNRLIEAECQRIELGRLEGPVIAAGTTGSVPATARLLTAIARSTQGAVILPGLDPHLEDEAWQQLVPQPTEARIDLAISHPQAIMARLVAQMGAKRTDIVSLGRPDADRFARARLVSDALRPANTTHRWREAPFDIAHAVEALAEAAIIEASDEREEALAIAIALREAVEEPEAHAALVTPDRGLAQRVAIELARWNIEVDDSAGKSLARSLPGHLALTMLKALASSASPVTLADFIQHPLLRLGLSAPERQRAVSAIEIAVLRGGMMGDGLAGLLRGLASAPARRKASHPSPPLKRISDDDLGLARRFLDGLMAALSPLTSALANPAADFGNVAAEHAKALAALTLEDDTAAAFDGEAGACLSVLLDELALQATGLISGDARDYQDLLQSLIADEILAPPARAGARISILGLLEARIIDHDCVVLAGLNETVWPPEQTGDPFLNRPMRQELGLPSPERRIGQSAHDLSQLVLGSGRIILSRAAKAGLTQTVPSRFWQRLQAVTPAPAWQAALTRGNEVLTFARQLAMPATSQPIARPEPIASAELQPVRFSVTELERLARDPYAVFAKRILKLAPIEPLIAAVGARERGQLFHDILAEFGAAYPQQLPADARQRLMEIAEAKFANLADEAEVMAFWKPRFGALADMIIAWETQRRATLAELHAEIDGRADFALVDGTQITMTARADRIERRRDGTTAIVDFKTGNAPSGLEIDVGLAAQLTLQSVIASRGGFSGITAAWPDEAAYVSLKSRKGGALAVTKKAGEELVALSNEQLDELRAALSAYRSGARGFISRLAPKTTRDVGDYDALARVKEWSRGGDEDEGPSE
ncbi:MAG: double-strand break repair protein AddB [Bosea sp. (in: a-proteobacteria)]